MVKIYTHFALVILLALHVSAANADIFGYADANGAIYLTDSPTQVTSQSQADKAASKDTTANADEPTQPAYELIVVSPPEPISATSAVELAAMDDKAPINAKGLLYKDQVKIAALDSGIETALLHAVIMTESNYNARAISPKGARGLMQLMPHTAKRFGVNNADDPKQNIQGGARYLSYLLKLFKNDFSLAIAAYNAGENAVIEHGNTIPPYRETLHYVIKVLGLYKKLRAA